MNLLLTYLSLSLTLLLSGRPCAASETFIRGGAEEVTELPYGNMTEDQSISARLLSERRRLLPKEGVLTALIIRTTDSAGNEPPTSAAHESDVWFGTYDLEHTTNQNSMVRQNLPSLRFQKTICLYIFLFQRINIFFGTFSLPGLSLRSM